MTRADGWRGQRGPVARIYLLTGRPGVGKTTCLRKALDLLRVPAGGFFTEELRDRERRVGFRLETLDGRRATLAHADRPGGPRVGRYGVNLEALERVGVPSIRTGVRRGDLVVIDEIGKMEMASAAFRSAVEEVLAAPVIMLGTILESPHPWADRVKGHPAVALVEVTAANRESLPDRLAGLVTAALRARV